MNTLMVADVPYPLFGGGVLDPPLSCRQMICETISFRVARAYNARWHSRLPRFGTGFIENQPFLCFGAMHDERLYAVAIWSNPAARNLPQREWLELRRLAIAPEAPRYTATWMLAKMRKYILRNRSEVTTLVSYQDTEVHAGTIYRAAGWKPTIVNRDGNWTREKRPRSAAQSLAPKQRWELVIRDNKA